MYNYFVRTSVFPGNTVFIKATGGGTVTIGRNGSQKINSAASDATLMSGNGVQLVYVDDTIGWLEIQENKIALVGAGNIGTETINLSKPFFKNILAYDPFKSQKQFSI